LDGFLTRIIKNNKFKKLKNMRKTAMPFIYFYFLKYNSHPRVDPEPEHCLSTEQSAI
jgi:hypothetical protein